MMDIQKQQLTIEGAVTYSRLFDALKGMYEVDDDDSVWEIFNQADDQLEEVVNALKLLSAPPAPVKLPSLKQTISGERYVWSDGVYNYQQDVIEILKAAGVVVEVADE